jgi:hypothetical protein
MTEAIKQSIKENVQGFHRKRLCLPDDHETLTHKIKDRNILICDLRSQAQVMFDILTDGTDNKQIPIETLDFWRKQLKTE